MKRTIHLFMALLAILSCRIAAGQDYVTTPADRAVAEKLMRTLSEANASAGGTMPVADLMVLAAKEMQGTPYVAGTLDEDPTREQMRLYLTRTDCIIFVETCLNLALVVKKFDGEMPPFGAFAAGVARTRYRSKAPYTYGDRIHYTTEWIRRQGTTLKDVTLDLGGEVNDHPIHFMTSHPKSYKQLEDASNIPRAALDLKKIGEVEASLNKEPMTYIPKSKVAAAAAGIKTGDIICYVSTVEGLDIAHVAIALVEGGRVGFIHASQADGKVEIDKQTIAEYVGSRSHLSGIKVVRPL